MTPYDEHMLYLRYRRAWAQYVAPRRAQMLADAKGEEKRRMWDAFGRESRDAIRELKETTD